MLSAIITTTRRLRRTTEATRKSRRSAKQSPRFERLEDRKLLTVAPFFGGLGDLPGDPFSSSALGISDDGRTVVGVGNWDNASREAFRWTESTNEMQSIGPLDATTSSARKASADGNVIVGQDDSGSKRSVRWVNGTIVEIPDLPGGDGTGGGWFGAYDVSDDGTAAVGATPSSQGDAEAYIWRQGADPNGPGQTTGLGDLPGGTFYSVALAVSGDGSTVVGWGTNADNQEEAVRWTGGVMEPLGNSGLQSRARDVSADGSVVVGYDVLSRETVRGKGGKRLVQTSEAFRWSAESGMQHLGDLPGGENQSVPFAVSADGSVIAGQGLTENGSEAFVWDASKGMRKLQDVLVSEYGLDLTGWQLERVSDMTPDGLTFVGRGINPDGSQEAFIARITPPQPGITVTPSSGIQTSEDGTTEVIDVVLDAEPTAEVTINVSSSDVAEGEVVGATNGVLTLTFDATNWNTAKQVTIQGVEDEGEQDGNQPYSIQLDPSTSADPAYAALSSVDVSATNLDNDAPLSTMFVADISLSTSLSGNNKTNHHIEVLVMQETGTVDVPLAGVQVTVTFANKTFTGLTDSEGIFRSEPIKGVKSGEYFANVIDLALTDFVWDPLALDLEDDTDEDGLPDNLLSIE